MASLRDTVKDYQDELRDGIAWVAFWKQGRSWNGEDFYLDTGDSLTAEQKSRKSANAPAAALPSMRARKTITVLTGTAPLSCGRMTAFSRNEK